MGTNKALVELGSLTLLARAVELIEPVASPVTIVGMNKSQHVLHVASIRDREPGCGPLGGIVTALAIASKEWALVLACDMPYVTVEFLQLLSRRCASASPETQAVVPETSRGLEPLCAIYRASASKVLEASLAGRKLKLTDVVATLRVDRVVESDWLAFSADGKLFTNINRPEDLAAARQVFER